MVYLTSLIRSHIAVQEILKQQAFDEVEIGFCQHVRRLVDIEADVMNKKVEL